MGRPAGWMTELTGRSPMKAPGKPSLRRDTERSSWHEIGKGLTSEEAAVAVGASPAAYSRWFRDRGGMPTFLRVPVSGRFLSFEEREDIALPRAQGAGVREIARRLGRHPSTVSRELRRSCGHPRRQPRVSRLCRAVEGRTDGATSQGGQAARE